MEWDLLGGGAGGHTPDNTCSLPTRQRRFLVTAEIPDLFDKNQSIQTLATAVLALPCCVPFKRIHHCHCNHHTARRVGGVCKYIKYLLAGRDADID